MTVAFVLATGPSMTQAQVDRVRGCGLVVAVSDAYRLAPWADAMCSQDAAWWRVHGEAKQFAGRRFSGVPVPDCQHLPNGNGGNSGLLGIRVATELGAKCVILLGFDLGGTHFFGPHPDSLKNTPPHRFEVFQRQFAAYRPPGVTIINCTPGSALRCYPKMTIDSAVNSGIIGT